ncbi:SPFH domain-containing protein, partial [Singulisphaera rosea]
MLGLAVPSAIAWRSAVVVDETQFVLITEFGRLVAILGDTPGETGLSWKWPWQSTEAIDRRLQVFGPPAREVITGDKRNLEVASYVVWRVDEPARFLASAGTLDAAEARLDERV